MRSAGWGGVCRAVGRAAAGPEFAHPTNIFARPDTPPKTQKSRKPIYLPTSLYNDLLALRDEAEDQSPSGWIFASARARRRKSQGGEGLESRGVMTPDYNWVIRNLKPVAKKLDIRVNCQIMRRTFATLANEVGGDLKDIQAQMRHSRSATTADIYVQPIASSVRRSIEALDLALRTPADSKGAGKR